MFTTIKETYAQAKEVPANIKSLVSLCVATMIIVILSTTLILGMSLANAH